MKALAYLKLMRFHKPIGILLLWWPTAWALWLANDKSPPPGLVLVFFVGTVVMRAAGCVINDIADRHMDCHVERTKTRPLTRGDVGLIEAWGLLMGLLCMALWLLLQLPKMCFYYALMAVLITMLYPFCKRFLQCPQLILGLAFSMSIPMVYAASNQPINSTMLLLLGINLLWVIAYDTEYAMVDREDDLRIGIKSSAILFASYDKQIIAILQAIAHACWLLIGSSSWAFDCGWVLAGMNLIYQHQSLNQRTPEASLAAFTSNHWYGLIMWFSVMGSH